MVGPLLRRRPRCSATTTSTTATSTPTPSWIEVGLNASHMVGPHHVLFEGNYGFNWDSDKTHGNAIYHTIFRNHLARRPPGLRRRQRQRAEALRRRGVLLLLAQLRRQRARRGRADEWLGLRDAATWTPRRSTCSAGTTGRPTPSTRGGRHRRPARQLRLRDQLGEVGPEHLRAQSCPTRCTSAGSRPSSTPAGATPGPGWTPWERRSSTRFRPRPASTPALRSSSPDPPDRIAVLDAAGTSQARPRSCSAFWRCMAAPASSRPPGRPSAGGLEPRAQQAGRPERPFGLAGRVAGRLRARDAEAVQLAPTVPVLPGGARLGRRRGLSGGPLCEVHTPGARRGGDGDRSATSPRWTRRAATTWSPASSSSHPFQVGAEVFDGRSARRSAPSTSSVHSPRSTRPRRGPVGPRERRAAAPAGVRAGWHDAGDFSHLQRLAQLGALLAARGLRRLRPVGRRHRHPRIGQRHPRPPRRGALGAGVAALGAGRPTGGFRNSTCQERYGPYGTNSPRAYVALPRRRGGDPGHGPGGGTLAYGLDGVAALRRGLRRSGCCRPGSAGDRYLEAHPESSDGPTCPAYRADGDEHMGRHTRMYAAAGHAARHRGARFRRRLRAELRRPWTTTQATCTLNGFAARLYLRAPGGGPGAQGGIRASLATRRAVSSVAEDGANPFERAAPTFWGSIGAGFTADRLLQRPTLPDERGRAAADCDQAAGQRAPRARPELPATSAT